MKKSVTCALGAAAVVAISLSFVGNHAEAQTPPRSSAGTPPIGRLVEIHLVAWPLSTTDAGKVGGTLISMTDQWIIVQDGTFEIWLPKDKVMSIRASR